MDINVSLKLPEMPDFLTIQLPGTTKPDQTIPIETLTREQAEKFADLMRKRFMDHWESKDIIRRTDERAKNRKREAGEIINASHKRGTPIV
jgi:hypothetical protein